ncbi:MAG: FAD-dependent oxidoreductase [Planctomycetota bacterium]
MKNEIRWKVAIIGAGIAGASAGQQLSRNGASVKVFDRGRGPGGRCATTRYEHHSFDYGAQFFTARDPRFQDQVADWAIDRVIARWRPRLGEFTSSGYTPSRQKELWVGQSGMSAISHAMLDKLDAQFCTHIVSIKCSEQIWSLCDDDGNTYSGFDQVLITTPAPQASLLLDDCFSEASHAANDINMLPCWSLMLAFKERVEMPFDAAKVFDEAPISWLARNSSKPGYRDDAADCWVVQANSDWSSQHIELEPYEATEALLSDFSRLCKLCGVELPEPTHSDSHLWRYAFASPDTTQPYMLDQDTGVAVAGDWLCGGRIEGAWLSGFSAAEELTATWHDRAPITTSAFVC